MPLPTDVQLSLLSRILVFEASFAQKGPRDTVRIGIVYQPRFRASRNAMSAVCEVLDSSETRDEFGFHFDYVLIDVGGGMDGASAAGVDLLYVTPLRSLPVERVASFSRDADVLTFTGVPEYVRAGIAIGVDLAGGRPRILVNLDAVREEGAVLSSELLRLAEIVNDG